MKRITTILILTLFTIVGFAQQAVITGKITDANTNEPIPFANVFVEGSTIHNKKKKKRK